MLEHDERMNSQELRATWGLGTVFSLRMLGMFMVLPVLTTYGLTLSGATESLIGIAIGIYGLTQALFQIPFGLLSDRVGRKPLIIFGLLIFTLGSIIAATTDSIWGVILGRALQGSGAIAAAVMALLSDLTREQHRTKAMAFIGVSFGITFATAMVVGPVITQAFGLSGLFWGIALLASLAIIITVLLIPTPHKHVLNRDSAIVKGCFNQVIKNSRLLKLNIGILCLHTLLMLTFLALPHAMSQAGFAPEKQWLAYLVTMLVSFVMVIPFIIYAEKKRKMVSVFIFCIILIALSQALLWLVSSHLWLIFLGLQLFFLAFNLMEALLPSLISKEAPAGYKGTAMGIYSTSQFIGVAIGGSLGGGLLSFGGVSTVFLACLIIALLWALLSLTMQEPPYVSSMRLILPAQLNMDSSQLAAKIADQAGVTEVFIVDDEQTAYIKSDTQLTNRRDLEALISAAQKGTN